MIFAEKLMALRKKSGWSQEELAEQMKVTKQSVSRWEEAQSIPDMNEMIQISRLFEVSLDYLLKDEIEESEALPTDKPETMNRIVSMEEANKFLKIKYKTASLIAFATFLCIISPICLLFLGVLSEVPSIRLSENMAGGAGLLALIAFITVAVVMFMCIGDKTSSYDYLTKSNFETVYGVRGMVKERQEKYRHTYNMNNIIGTVFCIISVVPLFGAMMFSENDLLIVGMVCILLILIGIGVMFFIKCGVVWASYETLLQEGDYSKEKKKNSYLVSAISTAYWLITTAIYLGYSFITDAWKNTWIVWPIAGVLYAVVCIIMNISLKSYKMK